MDPVRDRDGEGGKLDCSVIDCATKLRWERLNGKHGWESFFLGVGLSDSDEPGTLNFSPTQPSKLSFNGVDSLQQVRLEGGVLELVNSHCAGTQTLSRGRGFHTSLSAEGKATRGFVVMVAIVIE